MIVDKKIFRPIKGFGSFLIASSFLFWFFMIIAFRVPDFHIDIVMIILMIIVTAWHMLTGLGVLFKKPWGFYLLKFYLYLSLLCWPIGTMYAKWLLKYIEDNDIKIFFFNKIIEI